MTNPLDTKLDFLKKVSDNIQTAKPIALTKWQYSQTKTKRPRPTLQSMIQKCQDYYDLCVNDPTKLPTLTDLSQVMGVTLSYLHKCREEKEIDEVLTKLHEMQEDRLIINGLKNRYNANFVMFMLKAKHGYKEQANNLTQNNNFTVSKDLIADALEFAKKNKSSKLKVK